MTVQRMYPEGKSELIKWIEDNFHEIDSFVATFSTKDGEIMTIHHCNSWLEAMGMNAAEQATLADLGLIGEFEKKEKD